MSVLINHHPRKAEPAAGQAARGSGALTGFTDISVEMKWFGRPTEDDRRRTLAEYSRHADTPQRLVIELNADGTDYAGLGDFAVPELDAGWSVLVGVLEDASRKLTRQQIRDAWPADYPKPDDVTLWRWLDRSVGDGRVLPEGTGRERGPFRYWLLGMEEKWANDPNRLEHTLAQTQRRPDGLEGTYAPLPGRALVLRDHATGLFVDVLPCADAYTNERALVAYLKDWWQAGDVVAADSNFCPEELFRQPAVRDAFLVARHHGGVGLPPLGPARRAGRTDTGEAWEQPVRYAETDLVMRRVTVRLDRPTRAGDREIRLLTMLPADRADALAVAAGYRGRRTIEAAFQELEAAVRSEVDTLAYPAAALFGFSIGLVLCNLLQVVRVALESAAADRPAEPISGVLLSQEVAAYLAGLPLLDLPAAWPQADWDAGRVAAWLRERARGVDRRHSACSHRAPKQKKQWQRGRKRSLHASTARLLQHRSKTQPNAP